MIDVLQLARRRLTTVKEPLLYLLEDMHVIAISKAHGQLRLVAQRADLDKEKIQLLLVLLLRQVQEIYPTLLLQSGMMLPKTLSKEIFRLP